MMLGEAEMPFQFPGNGVDGVDNKSFREKWGGGGEVYEKLLDYDSSIKNNLLLKVAECKMYRSCHLTEHFFAALTAITQWEMRKVCSSLSRWNVKNICSLLPPWTFELYYLWWIARQTLEEMLEWKRRGNFAVALEPKINTKRVKIYVSLF